MLKTPEPPNHNRFWRTIVTLTNVPDSSAAAVGESLDAVSEQSDVPVRDGNSSAEFFWGRTRDISVMVAVRGTSASEATQGIQAIARLLTEDCEVAFGNEDADEKLPLLNNSLRYGLVLAVKSLAQTVENDLERIAMEIGRASKGNP